MLALLFPLTSAFAPPNGLLGPLASSSGVPRFDLKAELDGVAKAISGYFNNSIYIGVQGVDLDPANPIGVADGDRDRFKAGKQQATADDLVPGGSITKATAAVLALQLAEQGKLDLDKPITDYIDPWFAQLPVPRFSLAIMWGNASIMNVTTRMLLSMRSGLMDYDDTRLLEWTALQGAPRDFEPLDFVIWATDHSFLWTPGGGGFYSGTGYVLLGMVLASASGAKQWFDLDQAAIFDPLGAEKKAWYANQTVFMGKGACSGYGPRVIPQYVDLAPTSDPNAHPSDFEWVDLLTRQSCLNGWTMGNILTTPQGLAQFYADLYYGKLLSPASMKEMTTFQPLTLGTVPPAGTPYGLGQMLSTIPLSAFGNASDKRVVNLVGHGGEDWGSGFPSANWAVELNVSLVIGINNGESPVGMNTSLTVAQNAILVSAAYCVTLDALFRFRGQAGVGCHASDGSFKDFGTAGVAARGSMGMKEKPKRR